MNRKQKRTGQSEQSLPKGINLQRVFGISLEGMMLKMKLQYYGHLMRRVDSLEKTLMEEKGPTEDKMAEWHH